MAPAKKTLKYIGISKAAFEHILSLYPSTVPENLRELDALRYDTIPATVRSRSKKGKYLTKDEVVKLVEWKLKHGTFRPKLLDLVSSNSAKEIEKTTQKAFSGMPGDGDDWMCLRRDAPMNAMAPLSLKDLVKLKGIGPATASLLLSVDDPVYNPFFSDELFRWMMWDMSNGGFVKGWERQIKYTAKEYEALLEHVNKFRGRFGATAVEMEKVAWVLGRNRIDVKKDEEEGLAELKKLESAQGGQEEAVEEARGDGDESEVQLEVAKKGRKRKAAESEDADEATEDKSKTNKKAPAKKAKKDAKRKSVEMKAPVEGVRRSSRRKTT